MTDNSAEASALRPIILRTIQVIVGGAGVLLVAGALAADQEWLDRHFLPVFFRSRERFLQEAFAARLAAGAAGLCLVIFIRPALDRLLRRKPAGEIIAAFIRITLALVLALFVSEFLLARKFAYAAVERRAREEPLRRPDPLLGWTFVPGREGKMTVAGRPIGYTMDAHGYRVRAKKAAVDPDLPTILFTGESIMAGFGLTWDESIPAQVGALLKIQTANMAVFEYASDQAYLHVKAELPHFRRPIAVVSIFAPALFFRDLENDRPHLGPDLSWHPAVHHLWLSSLFFHLVRYQSVAEIEHGIRTARAVLAATAALARKRRAVPIVVDPQYGPESLTERILRQRILDQPGISYVRVQLDPAWRLPRDLHPDPRAARAIAVTIARHLQSTLARSPNPSSSGLLGQGDTNP